MTFNEQISDSEIRKLCENAIEELQRVNSDSSLQKKNIDAIADKKKKQIIIELAKNLEDKIPTNTICIEIVNQLRGIVSESFIRKCLDQKYKDIHRSLNAKQQNKAQTSKPKTDPEKFPNGLKKVDEEYAEVIIVDKANNVDNLALQGALDQMKAKEEEEEEQLKEVFTIAGANGNQMLFRGDESNSFDEDVCSDTNYHDLDSKIPLTEEDNPLPSSSSSLIDLFSESTQQILPSKCSDCERKDRLIHLKNITIEELEQAIKKSTQLVSADKLVANALENTSKESTKQEIHFNLTIPFEELRRDMTSSNRPITSNMNIIFSGYYNQDTGKVYSPSWTITTKSLSQNSIG